MRSFSDSTSHEKRSTVFRAKVESAVAELGEQAERGRGEEPRPWEAAILKRQREVRAAYINAVKDLRTSKDAPSRQAAAQLADFLKNLPPIETERHRLKRELAAVIEAGQKEQCGPQPPVR